MHSASQSNPPDKAFAFGIGLADLYDTEKLAELDARFLARVEAGAPDLLTRLLDARRNHSGLSAADESALLIALGPHLETFLAQLFACEEQTGQLASATARLEALFLCKRLFIQRQAIKRHNAEEARSFDGEQLARQLEGYLGQPLTEAAFATAVMYWLKAEDQHGEELGLAKMYGAWATLSDEGRAKHVRDVLFKVPGRVDPMRLIPLEVDQGAGVSMLRAPESHRRGRDGFSLSDTGTDLRGALDQINYCIWCHTQGKDSCSKGLKDKKTGAYQKSAFNVTLAGCPLEEKISEMHTLKAQGLGISALAMIVVDNPMAAATGHRICNDCMKGCIYQKQDPVDIPQAETRILKDVLDLPWGFEIYSLLTRWNPLNIRRPLPKPSSGHTVLVVGLGPAGFTLAHHLMNEGHAVVAIDGLKIEPLSPEISGVTVEGERVPFRGIRDVRELYEDLDDRIVAGFGGVAEYGITVRWNKNFLKAIRLLLERRDYFSMFGGIRFGGTITIDDAWAYGFDHIALCCGAGKPTQIQVPNGLAPGVRMASDFLMALQLTGAAKNDSIANLQLQLPVVVIGGGLTAIDTATEALAYYVRQVEKFLHRFDVLAAKYGESTVRGLWRGSERATADEYLAHGKAVREERRQAATEGRAPNFVALLDSWGGATVAYRRRLTDAPSYTLNHEEVAKALEEGVRFAENLRPTAIEVDTEGRACAVKFVRESEVSRDEVILPARSILVAAGTQPNTVLAREYPGQITLDGRYFAAVDDAGNPVKPEPQISKPSHAHVLMSVSPEGRSMSFFGDLHPSFAGNVVKAMASAKQGYPAISRILDRHPPRARPVDVIDRMNCEMRATVQQVNRLTSNIVEVVLHAPQAARAFQPGQFYRLQNYETFAARVNQTTLAMEGLAMTGAWVDRQRGLISVIALEMGGSSNLCVWLQQGEPVVLMGPTGMPTETDGGQTVALVGGGLGNAVLFSIGAALREAGCKVLYFAGYKKMADRYKAEQIEAAADIVVWCCDEGPGFSPRRSQDRSFVGNMVDALAAYGSGELGINPISLAQVDRMIVIGSDRMMAAVAHARHHALKAYLKPGHVAIGSINSPMQCMMKEICAQCLQVHRDPQTGKEMVVFSCFNQDQDLDLVDFPALGQRLGQNRVQEKLTSLWIDDCLKAMKPRESSWTETHAMKNRKPIIAHQEV